MDGSNSSVTAGEILVEANKIVNQRANDRDDGAERSMRRIVEIFNATTGRDLSESDGWAFMCALKLGRAFNAGQDTFNKDHFVDLAGYAGLLGESWSNK